MNLVLISTARYTSLTYEWTYLLVSLSNMMISPKPSPIMPPSISYPTLIIPLVEMRVFLSYLYLYHTFFRDTWMSIFLVLPIWLVISTNLRFFALASKSARYLTLWSEENSVEALRFKYFKLSKISASVIVFSRFSVSSVVKLLKVKLRSYMCFYFWSIWRSKGNIPSL